MKKITRKSFTLFMIISVLIVNNRSFSQENSWKLAKNGKGIKVFTRTVSSSGFKEFKGETTLNTSVSDIVRVLKDANKMGKWVYNCKKVELLSLEGNEQYHYIETLVPWPFENRDMVYHFHYEADEATGKVKVEISGKRDYVQEKDNIIRIPKATGFWELIPIEQGKVRVVYQMHAEPGGKIPEWLANMTVVDTPFKTLEGLGKMF